jgi:hypothetical protein
LAFAVAGCGGGGDDPAPPAANGGTTGIREATLLELGALVQYLRAVFVIAIAEGTASRQSGVNPCELGGTRELDSANAVRLNACVSRVAPGLVLDGGRMAGGFTGADGYAVTGRALGLSAPVSTERGRVIAATAPDSLRLRGTVENGAFTVGEAVYSVTSGRIDGSASPGAGDNGFEGSAGGAFTLRGTEFTIAELGPLTWTTDRGITAGRLQLSVRSGRGAALYEVTFAGDGSIRLVGTATTASAVVSWKDPAFQAALNAATQP